jgi:hypothetical protein
MQDAIMPSAGREALLSAPLLRSLGDLNRRFLALAGANSGWQGGDWALRVPLDVSQRIASLPEDRRAALSTCPYALFDLRFADEAHWLGLLQSSARWRVRDVSPQEAGAAEFVQLAVFYSWHLAASAPSAAPLVLGMTDRTVRALSGVTLDGLPALIESQRQHLSVRWADCKSFWCAVTSAARLPASMNLQRAQLFGLQVAAAARLSSA